MEKVNTIFKIILGERRRGLMAAKLKGDGRRPAAAGSTLQNSHGLWLGPYDHNGAMGYESR